MDIRITTTDARIRIETMSAALERKSNNAKMEIKQNHALLEIETVKPKIKIDQYEAFASAGRKNNLDLALENAQIGYEKAMQYIAQKAADGDRLAAIHIKSDPIVEFAERASYTKRDFNIDFIPKARPKISVEEGEVNVQLAGGPNAFFDSVQINFVPHRYDTNYVPGKVNIYMEQYPSVDIEYVGNNINQYV